MSTTHSMPPPAPQMYEESIHAQRNRRLLIVTIVLMLAGAAYGIYWWTSARFWVQTDNAYVTGNLVPVTAQATGIVTQEMDAAKVARLMLAITSRVSFCLPEQVARSPLSSLRPISPGMACRATATRPIRILRSWSIIIRVPAS